MPRTALSELDMEGWPNTPGTERVQRARDAREADLGDWVFEPEAGHGRDQALRDMELLAESRRNESFRHRAGRRFARTMTLPDGQTVRQLMASIAQDGNTQTTIGMAVMSRDPGQDGKGVYSFTRISRDPGWMGMDPTLPSLHGLKAVVVEAQGRPGRPGTVIALPADAVGDDIPDLEFPPGEARVLRDLIRHHGGCPVWAGASG